MSRKPIYMPAVIAEKLGMVWNMVERKVAGNRIESFFLGCPIRILPEIRKVNEFGEVYSYWQSGNRVIMMGEIANDLVESSRIWMETKKVATILPTDFTYEQALDTIQKLNWYKL